MRRAQDIVRSAQCAERETEAVRCFDHKRRRPGFFHTGRLLGKKIPPGTGGGEIYIRKKAKKRSNPRPHHRVPAVEGYPAFLVSNILVTSLSLDFDLPCRLRNTFSPASNNGFASPSLISESCLLPSFPLPDTGQHTVRSHAGGLSYMYIGFSPFLAII